VQPRYSALSASRIPSPVETVADPLGALASTRPKATGTPELDDTEDAVVGPPRTGTNFRPPPRTRNGFDLGRAAPNADRREFAGNEDVAVGPRT
jgi:hypothetical protein